MFEIIVIRNGVEEGRVALSTPISTIGRADNNQIVLAEDSVSRRHARFLVEGQKLFIEDLRSGNGTFLRNQAVEGRRELGSGDEIQITPFILRVQGPPLDEATSPQDIRTVMIPALASPAPSGGGDGARSGARLILRRGEAGKSSYTLSTAPCTIGRSEDRDVILTDPASSRRHATIHFIDGQYAIKDEGSANGVMINNVTVREASLNHGDRLVIGETEFEFVWPGAPQKVGGYGVPASANGAAANGSHDPYSETGIMPAYGNWPGQPGAAVSEMAYNPAAVYGTELGTPVVRKRSPLRLVLVVVLVVVGAAIGIKVVSDRGQAPVEEVSQLKADPCEAVGETCPDSTDQNCLNCLNKRARLTRGQELFGQKEFGAAVAEFQRILQDVDPLDDKAIRYRYISYEFWALTAMDEKIKDLSQTVAQKVQQVKDDFAKAQELYDRYAKSYGNDTPESTLAAARGQLSEAVSLLNGVMKTKVDDKEAEQLRSSAETLRGKALGAIARLTRRKAEKQEENFTQKIQALYEEAQTLKAAGSMVKAQAKFKEVIDADPDRKTQYVDQARNELNTISRSLKDRAKPLLNEAIAKIKNEQWVEARQKLQEALKIDPNLEEARAKLDEVNDECQKRARKLYSEAKVQFNVTQYSQAEKLLRQVLTFVPDKDDEFHQKAVKMLQDMGKN